MLVANATDGYREHHDQGQSTAHLHLLQSSNGMEFKTKRLIEPTIDPFDGGAIFVLAIPLIAGAIDGRKDAAIPLGRNPESGCHGTLSLSCARRARGVRRTAFF